MAIEPDVFEKARVEVLEALDLVGPGMPRSFTRINPLRGSSPRSSLLQGVVFLAARSGKDVCRSILGATRRQWRGS